MTSNEELASVALDAAGRQRLAQVVAELDELGPEEFGERYPDLDDPFEEEGPSPVQLLVGVATEAGTMVTLDWSGEESPGATREALTAACGLLDVTAPEWDPETETRVVGSLGPDAQRGDGMPQLFVALDAQLTAVGSRLLLVDIESDSFQLVPVTADAFERLVGTEGEEFALHAAAQTTAGGGHCASPSSDEPR